MKASLLFAAGGIFMFLAGRTYARSDDYVVTGTLKIHDEDANQIVAELRIGNSTDSHNKVLLMGKPAMYFRDWVQGHANQHVTLRLEGVSVDTKDGTR